jgi:ribose transport system substrate-binding protein
MKHLSKFAIGALTALLALPAIADEAPDWLGGDLKKPLSETRIGITVLYPGSNAYQAKYAETAEAYSKELGLDAVVMDPQGDPATQFNQIQDMVSQNMDAIVVWPTSQNALIPAIRQAARSGIPVVTSNSPIGEAGRRYIVGHTGPDDCAQAEQSAEMLADSLGGNGNIVVVEGTPGAQTVMETFLTQFGEKIDGVYAFDDGMGLGVISALQGAGKEPGEVKVVTCNQFGEGWDAMKSGWHSGSNKQSPIDDAILAIQTAVKVANGIDVPELQGIETPKVLPENVDQFERPTW